MLWCEAGDDDTETDPYETHNLASSQRWEHRRALWQLRAAPDTWLVETGDRGHQAEPRKVVAPFVKEMHDWFGTPDWYREDGSSPSTPD